MKIFHNDTEILDIRVDDGSYRYRAIEGDHNLTLYFSLPEHVEIPVGAYCVFQNETYTLEKPESLKMQHSRKFEYTVVFDSPQAKAGKWKFRNLVDRRLKFSLTATPREHLQMFVDNMNQRDCGWTIGRCIDGPEKAISYNHAFCIDALTQMADEWKTEYEFIGKQVSLWKVEYNRDNPLPLSYGKGNGFKPGIGRSNYEDSTPIEILYVQGGARNLDPSRYGSPELLLPKNQTIRFDGVHFEGEDGFDASKAKTYITDAEGFSIRRADKPLSSQAEDSLDCSEIYPNWKHTVTKAIEVKEGVWDIYAENTAEYPNNSPSNLNYDDSRIEGETASVIFQTGELTGKQFDLVQTGNALTGYDYATKKFELVSQQIDGMNMPGGTFIPRIGDEFRLFGVRLPDVYVCDNATKTGASWDMFREGVKYLYDNEEPKFSFTGELDGTWARRDWNNIGGRIRLGGFVQFSDERFQPESVLVRIIGIKDYINNPHSPEIELSNSTVGRTVASELRKIESNEVVVEDKHRDALQFTRRRFRDSRESLEMLKDAMLENFTESISPLTVQAMMMLVGDESLQFRFVESSSDPTVVAHEVRYDAATKVLSVAGGILQHLTLGIDTISASHAAGEYKFWELPAFETPPLTESGQRYYLYAKVSSSDSAGVFYISDRAIGMDSVEGCYHLLMGLLNSEYEGDRSFVSLYGFTEILPGRITTDKIVSSDGKTYFDLSQGEIGGNIVLTASEDYNDIKSDLDTIKSQTDKEYTIWFYDYEPALDNLPASQWTTDELKAQHHQDLFYNSKTGLAYRFEQAEDGTFAWNNITDHQTVKALENAAKAQDTADGKRRVFVSRPIPPYDVGDLWLTGGSADGELKKCIMARTSGKFYAIDWAVGVSYDNTKTVINGGLITSGTVQLASDDTKIKAGITGAGTEDSSVRIWAGESFANREKAPFRVFQDGSVVMSDATVEGTVTAVSGSIGGFEISATRIGKDWDSSSQGMSLLGNMIGFKRGDMQAAVGAYNVFGTNRLGQFINTASDYLPNYGLIFDVRNSLSGSNYAFCGNGNGILNGLVEGYRLNRVVFEQAREVRRIDPKRGKYIEVSSAYSDCILLLPRLSVLRSTLQLDTASEEEFAVRLTVVKRESAQGVRLYGRNTDFTINDNSLDTDEYPYLRNNAYGNERYWTLTAGDAVEILLVYSDNEYNAYTVSIHR